MHFNKVYDTITQNAAKIIGITDYGIEIGNTTAFNI